MFNYSLSQIKKFVIIALNLRIILKLIVGTQVITQGWKAFCDVTRLIMLSKSIHWNRLPLMEIDSADQPGMINLFMISECRRKRRRSETLNLNCSSVIWPTSCFVVMFITRARGNGIKDSLWSPTTAFWYTRLRRHHGLLLTLCCWVTA